MRILVCVKRVPATGARILLSEDEQEIVTRNLGFTISPHEECAVEEAIRLKEQHGGTVTVLTLGPPQAEEQLRAAVSLGADEALLLETDGSDWGPRATARALVEAIRQEQASDQPFDLLLFGNESADNGGYQVPVRVACALDLPCVCGIKSLEIAGGRALARREVPGGWEHYETPLPALFSVKEGINLPRYPSLPGRMRAKKKEIRRFTPEKGEDGLEKVRLKVPVEESAGAQVLGQGPAAAARALELLQELGLV